MEERSMTDTDRLDALAEAGEVLERGVTPCRQCGLPHDQRAKDSGPRNRVFVSWAAEDGHAYSPMTGKEVSTLLAAAVRELDELREALEGVVADIGRMKACAPDGDYIRWDVEHADPSLHYVNREGVIQRLRAALHREDGAS